MAFDEGLADRIRHALGDRPDVTEKKMFGGLAFLRDGKMFCGITKDELLLRLGPERAEVALGTPDVRAMDFTGRPMVGYVYVGPTRCRTVGEVRQWIEQADAFVGGLADRPARATRSKAKV
jgi:TfoX/Sxy family transcriptional regulator of competence genes